MREGEQTRGRVKEGVGQGGVLCWDTRMAAIRFSSERKGDRAINRASCAERVSKPYPEGFVDQISRARALYTKCGLSCQSLGCLQGRYNPISICPSFPALPCPHPIHATVPHPARHTKT